MKCLRCPRPHTFLIFSLLSILSAIISGCPSVSGKPGADGSFPSPEPTPLRTLTFNFAPVFLDDFSDNERNWDVFESENAYAEVRKGEYTIHYTDAREIQYSLVSAPFDGGDFIFQAVTEKCDGRSGHSHGIVWGAADSDNCHLLVISDTGFYTYGRTIKGEYHPIKDWTFTGLLKQGNAKNSLAVKRRNDACEIFFNGVFCIEAAAFPLFGDGIGFIVYPTICMKADSIEFVSYTGSMTPDDGIDAMVRYEHFGFERLDTSFIEKWKPFFDYSALFSRLTFGVEALLREHDDAHAKAVLERGIVIAETNLPGESAALAPLYKDAATASYRLGDIETSLAYAGKAFSFCGSAYASAHTWCAAGGLFLGRLNEELLLYDKAIDAYLETIALIDRDDPKSGSTEKAEVVRSLARCYSRKEQWPESIGWYKKAFEIDKGRNDKSNMFHDLAGIATGNESLGQHMEALSHYFLAYERARENRETGQIFESAYSAGVLLESLEQFPKAVSYFELAVEAGLKLGNDERLIDCYRHIANAQLQMGSGKPAVEAFKAGIRVRDRSKNPLPNDNIEFELGLSRAYALVPDPEKAMNMLDDAKNSAASRKDETTIARIQMTEGDVLIELGRYERARTAFGNALPILEKNADHSGTALCLFALARAAALSGDLSTMNAFIDKGINMAGRSGSDTERANAHSYAGSILLEADSPASALVHLNRARSFTGDSVPVSVRVRTALDTAIASHALNAPHDATTLVMDAIKAAESSGKKSLFSRCMMTLGLLELSRGSVDDAITSFGKGIESAKLSGVAMDEMEAYAAMGIAWMMNGDSRRAQEFFGKGLSLAGNPMKAKEYALFTALIGDIAVSLGNTKKAVEDYNRAISSIEKTIANNILSERTPPDAFIGRASRSLAGLYARYFDPIKAVDARQTAMVVDLDRLYGVQGKKAVSPWKGTDAFRRRLDKETAVLVFVDTSAEGNGDSYLIVSLTKDGVRFAMLEMNDVALRLGTMIELLPAPTPAVPRVRLPREIPEYFGYLNELQKKDNSGTFERIIGEYFTALSSLPRNGNADVLMRTAAQSLYESLITPVAASLAGKSRLIIVPDAVLSILPFESLQDRNGTFLASQFLVRYAHSLSVIENAVSQSQKNKLDPLLLIRGGNYARQPETKDRSPEQVFTDAFIDRVSHEAGNETARFYNALGLFPRMPDGIDAEEKSVIRMSTIRTAIVLPDAGKTIAADRAFGVIHFAADGMIIPRFPGLSCIVDGHDGGRLRAIELVRLPFQPAFVFCPSTRLIPPEHERTGSPGTFAESFLIAGASGVLLSMWHVPVPARTAFITKVYSRALTGNVSIEDAIGLAKRELIQGTAEDPAYADPAYADPAYWSGYFCY